MQADLEAFVRDAKLPVSSIALAEFMKGLFEEKLAAQKEALMQGRQLADIIAQEIVHSEHTMSNTGVDSGRFSSHNISTASGAIATGSVPPPSSGGAKWALIAVPLMIIAAAGGVFVMRKPEPAAGQSTQTAEPAVQKATLVVKSDPPGAHIWINGEVRSETTPATIENLPIGKVDVKVGMEGYASKTEKVELVGGAPMNRNFTLQKGSVTVQVTGAPAGATATLDGKTVALPNIEATPGDTHTVVISAPGFASKTVKVHGDIGETKKIDAALDKAYAGSGVAKVGATTTAKTAETAAAQPGGSGKLMVSAGGGWCNVAVDGKPQGVTPTGAIEVSAGGHTISCTNADGKTVSQGAKVNAGEITRVKFSL
jgi:serine/threonine-protein kinase